MEGRGHRQSLSSREDGEDLGRDSDCGDRKGRTDEGRLAKVELLSLRTAGMWQGWGGLESEDLSGSEGCWCYFRSGGRRAYPPVGAGVFFSASRFGKDDSEGRNFSRPSWLISLVSQKENWKSPGGIIGLEVERNGSKVGSQNRE